MPAIGIGNGTALMHNNGYSPSKTDLEVWLAKQNSTPNGMDNKIAGGPVGPTWVKSNCLSIVAATAAYSIFFTDNTSWNSMTYSGTATAALDVPNKKITFSGTGTIWNIKIWSAAGGTGTLLTWLKCADNGDGRLFDSVGTNHGWTNTPVFTVQDTTHNNMIYGCDVYSLDSAPTDRTKFKYVPYASGVARKTTAKMQRMKNTPPSARMGACIVYDSVRNVHVLFGGYDAVGRNGETWEYNGYNWNKITTAHSPSARYETAMAFNPANGKTLLFGGDDGSSQSDTWEYDGSDWTQKSPVTVPAGRKRHAMCMDTVNNVILMYGGNGAAGTQTYSWNGTNWTLLSPVANPGVRYYHTMKCDTHRNRVVLFGGNNGSTYENTTWEWDGTNWAQVVTAHAPSARIGHGMCFDSVQNLIILAKGYVAAANNETWSYDGADWTQLAPITNSTVTYYVNLSYDISRNEIMTFGGFTGAAQNGETWIYSSKDWEKPVPYTLIRNCPAPSTKSMHTGAETQFRFAATLTNNIMSKKPNPEWSARYSAASCVHTTGGKTYVYISGGYDGSNYNSDIWRTSDGVTWEQMTGTGLPLLGFHSMVSFNNKIYILGGWSVATGYSKKVYSSIDGNSFSAEIDGGWDERRSFGCTVMGSNIVVTGGMGNGAQYNDLWIWDGSAGSWTNVSPTGGYSIRSGFGCEVLGTTLYVFGGHYSGTSYYDCYSWDGVAATWTHLTNTPWVNGALLASCVMGGLIYKAGGYDFNTSSNDDDVYSFDGATWTLIVNPSGWSARRQHCIEAMGTSMFVFSGLDSAQIKDNWKSTNSGSTWVSQEIWDPAKVSGTAFYDSLNPRDWYYEELNSVFINDAIRTPFADRLFIGLRSNTVTPANYTVNGIVHNFLEYTVAQTTALKNKIANFLAKAGMRNV